MQKELEIKTFPTRQEILEKINKIIEEDYCEAWGTYNPINEENLLADSLMDSFAYSMFWLNIQQPYNLRIKRKYKSTDEYTEDQYNKDMINWINRLDYKTYKVKHLINRIIRCM